jgi:hypothetical protein
MSSAFTAKIYLNGSNVEDDTLVLKGDDDYLKIVLSLVKKEYVLFPNVANAAAVDKRLKNKGLTKLVLRLGMVGIPKEALTAVLGFIDTRDIINKS